MSESFLKDHPIIAAIVVIVIILIVASIIGFIYESSTNWTDTGKINWVSVRYSRFITGDSVVTPYWTTEFNFSIVTLSHGSYNFTDGFPPEKICPNHCENFSSSEIYTNRTIGALMHINGQIDIYLG